MATPNPFQRLLMDFAKRLTALRKEHGLTQQALADKVGIHVVQVRRYEGGASQPSLEAIRKLSVALGISADALLFEPDERGPSDDLKMRFEALSGFEPEDRQVAMTVIDGLILQNQAKKLVLGREARKAG
jgi:transcriptional regulator with XRE-family HTH domain